MSDDRHFPVLGTKDTVPWDFVAEHAHRVRLNHGYQTLETLARRSGLSWEELRAATIDKPWHTYDHLSDAQAKPEVLRLVTAWRKTAVHAG